MAEQTPVPEPPDGSHLLIGEPPLQVLVIRDDGSAAVTRDVVLELPEEHRWWPADSGDGDPICWSTIADPNSGPDVDGLPRGLNRTVLCRLYTQEQLDQAVVEARRFGLNLAVRPVGEHLVETQGYCRTCGVHHSPEEIARLEDRLAEEDHSGQ